MTNNASQLTDDDENDSIYDELPTIATTPTVMAKDTILDSSSPDVCKLDAILDQEDQEDNSLAHPHPATNGHVVEYHSDEITSGPDGNFLDFVEDAPSPTAYANSTHSHDPNYLSARPNVIELDEDEDSREVCEITREKHIDVVNEDDDWFDSDENDVESLDSSHSSIPPNPNPTESRLPPEKSSPRESNSSIPIVSSLEGDTERRTTQNNPPGAISLLTRASQTFYKAFRKPKKAEIKADSSRVTKTASLASGSAETPSVSRQASNIDDMHQRLEQLLEAQIATLKGASTGFVDLKLVRPMTERTTHAIEHDARTLLADYGEVERRAKDMRKKAVSVNKDADEEVAAKEQVLIAAKMRLAEASAEVEGLKHELRGVKKILQEPGRRRRRRAEEIRREAVVVREARDAVERRLDERRRTLAKETAALDKVEKDYRDIEGDWA